ncbi:leucine-rich repeat-containing protein 41 [Triplophysa dalaica]|uniref:leucine-rich repeat-containing protein 41 n=1 Tax=Triplophysa dalaica TaxID=1582913 RepID=UPI0024DF45E5|nr:leucine-rich repeat-containing protein 41 [Triplophysa dalaica]
MGISGGVSTLVQMCIVKVAQNMDELERKISDLPVLLLKELLPHLSIYYLDRLEPVALTKGISTSSMWATIWRDLDQTWRCRIKSGLPGQDWKQRCLERLFHMVMFTQVRQGRSYLSNLSDSSVLSMTAGHVKVLSLHGSSRNICRLASEELRTILTTLEKGVRSLKLLDANSLLKHGRKNVLFVLHRLLDHGSVREVVLWRSPHPSFLSWITSRCKGPQGQLSVSLPGTSNVQLSDLDIGYSAVEGEPAAKRSRRSLTLELEDKPELMCRTFLSSYSTAGHCPEGQINSLDFEVSSCQILTTVSHVLPSWTRLNALHLHTDWLLTEEEMSVLVESLRRLFQNPGCSLRDLSMSHVCCHTSVISVLSACPSLQNLSLDIWPPLNNTWTKQQHFRQNEELCLEKLVVKSADVPTTVESFLTVLKWAPKLSHLQITGFRHAQQLFRTLSESNPILKILHLEDINLANCHQEILHLLENSMLEGLFFKDCRLLDKCTVKKDFLVPFVNALKRISSLQTLTLAHNRLATGAIEMAELFSGSCPSNITHLDLSSNFILPAELLQFAQLIETYRPTQRPLLDLRFNPLDRDPEVKVQAVRKLLPYCNILTDDWDSRSTMKDHISVM